MAKNSRRRIKHSSALRGKARAKAYARWETLKPKEKELQVRSLEVLRSMRAGEAMTPASRRVGIDPRTLKAWLGNYIFKKGHRWKARKKDSIERGMTIYEHGKVEGITIGSSVPASLIGEYFNQVKLLLAGEPNKLDEYAKVVIVDVNGKKHYLETRIEQIKEIELSREQEFGGEIYDY